MTGKAAASPRSDADKEGEGDGQGKRKDETNEQTQECRNGENNHIFNNDAYVEESGFTINFKIPYWLCGFCTLLSILVGVLAVFVVLITKAPKPDTNRWMQEVEERAGRAGVDMFQSYDLNRDGYLSIYEFEPLIPHLKNLSDVLDQLMPMDSFLDYSPKEGEEVLVLEADFTPLQLDTMTKEDILNMDFAAFWFKFARLYLRFAKYTAMPVITGKSTLFGLRNWTEVNQKHQIFGASEFRNLLPDDLTKLEVGQTFNIIELEKSGFFGASVLSSARYLPVKPKGKEEVLYRLLGMMHPRPFVNMRFPPRGTIGCVRALNDKYVHVVFRMHAEFQLNKPPVKPFWFTPAQFLGDLVMTRDGTHVHYFSMRVPTERRLNVDMEWLTGVTEGEEGMEVDIGYMPKMEWMMTTESHLPLPEKDAQSLRPDLSSPQTPDQMVWTSQESQQECLRKIEVAFYPFKKVTYYNLTEAVKVSKEENKPLHAVFLWGALDDQSC